VPIRPLVLITPSAAAMIELPRRLASVAGARAGFYPFKLRDFVRAVAEPALLGMGLMPWDSGHDALLATRLLDGPHGLKLDAALPRRPVAVALAKTLGALRVAGFAPGAVERLASEPAVTREDTERLRAVATLYRGFHEALEGHVSDPATLLRTAANQVSSVAWLKGAEVLIVADLETDALERQFLAALIRCCTVRRLAQPCPKSLWPSSFGAWAEAHGIETVGPSASLLAPILPPPPPAALALLRQRLFEPPAGESAQDESVELLTAPGEAAEVGAVVRRLLAAARAGVPFEELGVVLPRPETYAPLFTELLERLGVPFKLHPSLPLRFGRAARSLLLLFRCRGLERPAVMEFLTFAPIPFAEFLSDTTLAQPSRWDELSRDARIVSSLERWMIGLRAHAEAERDAAQHSPERREARERSAAEAEALLRVVQLLSGTLDTLFGEATWLEWSERLLLVLDQWIGPEQDREAVRDVIADLAGLGAASARARWDEVEGVLEARLEWERLPLQPVTSGAVHVGALDAMAGLPFRVLAIVGLVEGGYPGVVRPDPFLLDAERDALNAALLPPLPARVSESSPPRRAQLSLFDAPEIPLPLPVAAFAPLPTTQDRVLEHRRLFARAVSQASERLILSYPRADPRSGRERMPSLFFIAAASALSGRPLRAQELEALVVEDELEKLSADEGLDRGERDRIRVRHGGRDAAEAIAAGSSFFRHSRAAADARWSNKFTHYDGLIDELPRELQARLDPLTFTGAISASRLATFSRCGFQYMLQHVLRLEPALEPEERKRLEPLERGNAFHNVAERFLRERRELGELPVRDTPEMRARVAELGDQALDELVAGSPPRFLFLWERERARFQESLVGFLRREAELSRKTTPAHFEVSFGLSHGLAPGEPHLAQPLEIDLGEGRSLRVSGRIDRIDRREDGTLVLRDYKTGKAPRDDGGIFRGGKQLQIPFYVLAAARLFPGQPVVDAFLDYVDGGRQVAFDPALVRSDTFRTLLNGLVTAIASGHFVQEPSSCDWCDYKAVCGPKGLLLRQREYKISDKRVQNVLRLRDVG
jgi:ATP-dependent helicase/nuclease subunit B